MDKPRNPNWGGAREGAGRKLPPKFPQKVCVDVSDDQKAHIEARALADGVTVAEYMRRLIDADRGVTE